MTFEGALLQEQGVKFAIVVVKAHILHNKPKANEAQDVFARYFPAGIPMVLMAQDSRGVPTYYGRPDIVRFLSSVRMERIPWKRYTFN